jgi:hypothetical protein
VTRQQQLTSIHRRARIEGSGQPYSRPLRNLRYPRSAEPSATNEMLLADSRKAFGNADCIRSSDLVAALIADPERPWVEFRNGKPITQKQLAGLLRHFRIFSQTIDPPGLPSAKGYRRAQFEPFWRAYFPGQNGSAPLFTDFETSKRQ